MTITIDATVLWWLLGIALWLFLGLLGMLMGNVGSQKWRCWGVLFGGPFTFLLGAIWIILADW